MAERWKLSRAGITNVYQYTDEVLRFGGGRLLLRGVNGSGKSTAMNMLLPFLLDADPRRIDAAGDQAGVLRSWMLAGREETQPTGYLWIEMARGDDHLSFGCGLKANRKTGYVSHWWFVTDRRPGIDLHLVRRHGTNVRTPLSAEELRRELGPGHVWTMDQRPAYRAVLYGRLYGGADPEQHIRLLHIVRNPRVGDRVDDRIDVGLAAHLHDALPQLSEAAIDDAATPLEQLEEHRRNVSDLAATVDTLQALLGTYRQHARSELRGRAEATLAHVAEHRVRERAATTAREDADRARAAVDELDASIGRLQAEEQRLAAEIAELEASEAYAGASDLVARREAVAHLADEARQAVERSEQQARRAAEDRLDVTQQEQAVETDAAQVGGDLVALAGVVVEASLAAEVPAPPEVVVAPLSVGADVVTVPGAALSVDAMTVALAQVRAAAQVRSGEVAQALEAIGHVEAALAALEKADGVLAGAQRELDRAEDGVAVASTALSSAGEQWRSEASTWLDALGAHAREAGVAIGSPIEVSEADVATDHERLHTGLVAAADGVLTSHRAAEAAIDARLGGATAARDEARRDVDELARRDVPDPPAAPWQGTRPGPCLAEVVDFSASLTADERAGLEAALEASGLLMAEVRPDGSLAVGDLLVRGDGPAVEPLGRLLTVSVPAGHPDLPAGAVAGVLDAISVDPVALERDGATTVTTSGEFRIGPLRGRHAKAEAEHVGVTARRAALERMRATAAAHLADAVREVERVEGELAQVRSHIETATRRRAEVPSIAPLVRAVVEVDAAERRCTDAEQERDDARQARDEADRRHGRASDDARRICATAGLPSDRPGLASVRDACRQLPPLADAVRRSTQQMAEAVLRWTGSGERWRRSRQEADAAGSLAEAKGDEHLLAARALATLEDAIGLDAQEILATVERTEEELATTRAQLGGARQEVGPAGHHLGACETEVARTGEEVARSEAHSVGALHRLRAALAVPGLWPAAIATDDDPGDDDVGEDAGEGDAGPGGVSLPVVPSSTAGLRTLASATIDLVPPPDQAVTHDGVRTALLRRRADLGAGWDAVSHHPELDLPLAVEVTGPLGQMPLAVAATVAADQLRSKRGLLTAQQTDALRNLLQGLVAKEVAEKLHAATELVAGMNDRLREVRTTHGIGTSLRWRRREDLPDDLATTVDLLALRPHQERLLPELLDRGEEGGGDGDRPCER